MVLVLREMTAPIGRFGSARFVLSGQPFPGTASLFGPARLRLAALLGLLRHLALILVDPLARERAPEPVQELRSRIDLVVVLALRENRQLVRVHGEPRRRLGNVNKAVFD